MHRAYILIEWDAGPTHLELLDKMKEHNIVYSMMNETDLLGKIELAVTEYLSREEQVNDMLDSLASIEIRDVDIDKVVKENMVSSKDSIISCAKNCDQIPWWKFWAKKTICSCKDVTSIESNN